MIKEKDHGTKGNKGGKDSKSRSRGRFGKMDASKFTAKEKKFESILNNMKIQHRQERAYFRS
jgi:hypothetical protein